MSNPVIKTVIRTKFRLTSRDQASEIIRSHADAYLRLANRFGVQEGMEQVSVPPMIGVDPEMRGC
jgi:hypothetical protein